MISVKAMLWEDYVPPWARRVWTWAVLALCLIFLLLAAAREGVSVFSALRPPDRVAGSLELRGLTADP
jgi:hypothetical protein